MVINTATLHHDSRPRNASKHCNQQPLSRLLSTQHCKINDRHTHDISCLLMLPGSIIMSPAQHFITLHRATNDGGSKGIQRVSANIHNQLKTAIIQKQGTHKPRPTWAAAPAAETIAFSHRLPAMAINSDSSPHAQQASINQ
ncbi:hypothetical protein Nepgr_006602 [Nepenthes gracilis]|uniref:Uncharacterized protein n=1 Tax=Nepenthes gracilis TaxID=150966 RepID=A0AAD3S5C3_NEPGR|nr:hypothetical protein Nepgr_006602 [Nepenthes gracilis]